MPDQWSPEDVNRLLVTTTGCLCLLVLVVGTIWGISSGVIDADILGSAKSIGVGGGLVGLAFILYLCINAGLRGDKDDD